jgi:hypothetical protein
VAVRTVALGARAEVDGVAWVEVTEGLARGDRLLAERAGTVPEGRTWRMAPGKP